MKPETKDILFVELRKCLMRNKSNIAMKVRKIILSDMLLVLNENTEEEGIRPMTPLEHQWMDFKKVLSELILFQEEYEERTRDKLPGNKYHADKLMEIVNHAKLVMSKPQHPCPECGEEMKYVYEIPRRNNSRACPNCGRTE